jgi:D-alanyl-D-alanine carboxypeptidase (penicillin-binding protein 5/6)
MIRRIVSTLLVAACTSLSALSGLEAANSYIIVDNQTGVILGSKNPNEKVQIASLTKIATASVVLDAAQLGLVKLTDMAVVPPVAMSAGGTNPIGLQPGDAISLRDLIYSSLLASDNIAATTLAHNVGARLKNSEGLAPVENFVAHMNALARALKMKRTLFLNASGYDANTEDAVPYSTAADVARLCRYAYGEADFPFYVSQKSRVIHVFRNGVDVSVPITNTNELLGQFGIDGIKTGSTSRAGGCLALSSEKPPEVKREGNTTYVTQRRLQVVMLGSRNRFPEGLNLVNQGWALYDKWAAEGRKTKGSPTL